MMKIKAQQALSCLWPVESPKEDGPNWWSKMSRTLCKHSSRCHSYVLSNVSLKHCIKYFSLINLAEVLSKFNFRKGNICYFGSVSQQVAKWAIKCPHFSISGENS